MIKVQLVFCGADGGSSAIYPLRLLRRQNFRREFAILDPDGTDFWAGHFGYLRDSFSARLETTDPDFVRHLLHMPIGAPGIEQMFLDLTSDSP